MTTLQIDALNYGVKFTIVIDDTSGLYYKSFMIVIYDRNDSTIIIYDRNDSGLYYKTTNVARHELKLCSKLKHNLRSYNRNLWS
jgi:hypothetical protein